MQDKNTLNEEPVEQLCAAGRELARKHAGLIPICTCNDEMRAACIDGVKRGLLPLESRPEYHMYIDDVGPKK